MNGDENAQLMHQMGRVLGLLEGIQRQLGEQHAATNRRIDDLKGTVDTRFEGMETNLNDIKGRIDELEDSEKAMIAKTAGMGMAGGGIMALVIEGGLALIKRM